MCSPERSRVVEVAPRLALRSQGMRCGATVMDLFLIRNKRSIVKIVGAAIGLLLVGRASLVGGRWAAGRC